MTTTRYLWNPINQNIIREYDGAGNTIANYTTEPGLHGDVISQHRDGQESFYHSDGQGSTFALTNSAGDVTDTYSYNAFGEVTNNTGDTVNPFQFIGQRGYYWDDETGGHDVRQRPLSTRRGRWLSVDPSIAAAIRYYVYASNSPINLLDPSGLQDVPVGAKVDEKKLTSPNFRRGKVNCAGCGNYDFHWHIESGGGGERLYIQFICLNQLGFLWVQA
jgi:RHS repeat-associated protein